MPELFIELFSEEIPARLQARGAAELARLVTESLAALAPSAPRTQSGPRRVALVAEVAHGVAATATVERGPRVAAPEQALAGFLRKHHADRAALRQEGDFWVLDRAGAALDAAALVASAMPGMLRRFAWPKAMRWGAGSAFTWIRPLRRIVCLLDGQVVPFTLAAEGDDGHKLASGDVTEGHRVHAPGPVRVAGFADWQDALRRHRVVADAGERARLVREGVAALAAARGLSVVDDPGLVEEVAGLVEWPVPLLGRIDAAFMDLPPEVMQVSMRVNQRYFALRQADGRAAPWFGFAANLDAPDAGAAIVAGNERVLRARFSDARHFWDLDRRTKLADRVAALDAVTFHARLGSQGDRVRRLVALAGAIAPLVGADAALAERAAQLCKADLVTGMVGEFPELQGVMGAYYALHDGEDARVAAAVRDHYAPRGAGDTVPAEPVAMALALADKLDQLTGFFLIGQKPTGSGDPYALRRAALGVIRILLENTIHLPLLRPFEDHVARFGSVHTDAPARDHAEEMVDFVRERLRVLLRGEGVEHDALQAGFAGPRDDDVLRLATKSRYLSRFLGSADGKALMAAFTRTSNILRAECKDGEDSAEADVALLREPEEVALHQRLLVASSAPGLVGDGRYEEGFALLASLRSPVDHFFDRVLVKDPDSSISINRLRLLGMVRGIMNQAAHFAAVAG